MSFRGGMMQTYGLRAFAVGALLVYGGGCGGDKSGGPGEDLGDGDLGQKDAAQPHEEDAGSQADAGSDAGGDSRPMPTSCSVIDDEIFSFDAARAEGPIFSAAMIGDMAHVVYLVASCGGTPTKNNAQGLEYVSFGTTGGAADPVGLVGIVDCDLTRYPQLVSSADGALQLFYTSNAAGSFELFSMDVLGGMPAVRQTTDGDNEVATATAAFGSGAPLAAYGNDQPVANPPAAAISTKRVGKQESEVVTAADGYHASHIAVAGLTSSDGGVVAWVSDRAEKPGIFLRRVNAAGEGSGDVTMLSDKLGGASNVELASGESGAAAVYTVLAGDGAAQELRFRAIDPEGAVGGEVRLTSGNQNVRDASIARFSSGYVVAYRRLSGPAPSMHLLFVDEGGNVGGERHVADASAGGAGVRVMVGNDGRVVLVWGESETEQGEAGITTHIRVRAARLECL